MTDENPTNKRIIPSVSITTARTGASTKADAMGMRPMQQRAYARIEIRMLGLLFNQKSSQCRSKSAHSFLQWRPSRFIRSSASFGPQVPAA